MVANATEPEILEFDLPHLRMTALAWGERTGRLALCLHGFPDSAWTWRFLGPVLAARGFRVVAPFTRGYAPTAIPADGDFHIGALMFDALAVYRRLDAPRDAVLIGHDWGALTVNALAAYPDCPFTRAVSMAVPPIPALRPNRPAGLKQLGVYLRQARFSWYIAFVQLPGIAERSLDRLIPRLWSDWSPGYPAQEDIAHTFAAMPTPEHRTAALSYYRAFARVTRRPVAPYAQLHRSWDRTPGVPMLYLHGQRDRTLHPALTGSVADVLPRGSRVETVDNAGHFLHLEQPDTVAALVSSFLGPAGMGTDD